MVSLFHSARAVAISITTEKLPVRQQLSLFSQSLTAALYVMVYNLTVAHVIHTESLKA